MNGKHSSQDLKCQTKDWVAIAKKFGEDCVAIQKDPKLSIDDKLKNQKVLGDKMIKEIESCSQLNAEEKRKMTRSVHQYVDEWTVIHDIYQKGSDLEKNSNPIKK